MDAILEPGGVVAINMVGRVPDGPSGTAWRCVHRTLAERFAHVRMFATDGMNLLLFASHEPLASAGSLGDDAVLASMERGEFHATDGASAYTLTDDYNPMDELLLPFMIQWREDIIRTERTVLLFDGTR